MMKPLLKSLIPSLHGEFAADELLKTCEKYHVDMKIHGFEMGMEFNQDIEIVDGRILKDEELHFENYQWDCICPNMGG